MSRTPSPAWHKEERLLLTFARNVSTRYLAIAVAALIGLLVLPFNVRHLGTSAYGLWMLTASITTYFTVMELGYGGAVVRFVAEYRAKRDAQSLNEILSTLFFVFTAMGIGCYLLAVGVAALMPAIFNLAPDQVHTGRMILLIVAANVTMMFIFSVFGGVVNGFQRYYLNNVIGTATEVLSAAVNVAVLLAGYGLVELVAAVTLVRMAPYYLYRRNAHLVFPDLDLSWRHFRKQRLREVTGFSIYLAIINWSSRLNYAVDSFTIGIFLNTAAVGVYAIALRLSEALFRMTHQLQVFLFPTVVHRAVEGRTADQRRLLVQATRFQIAIAAALCASTFADAEVLIATWVGPHVAESARITQILAVVVVLRACMAMPGTLLKGTGRHRYVAKVSAASAVANVLLSVVLVQWIGLIGVALGTLIPATAIAFFAIFPAACAEVELPVLEGLRRIVWPALWPALLVVLALEWTRPLVPLRLVAVLAHMAMGALTYAAVFVAWGLDREERGWLGARLAELWRRRAQVLAAA